MGLPRVEVYYNLHEKCLSVRHTSRGAKVRHASAIIINDVRLAVQPAGREKVIREKKKNVHAYLRGEPVYIREVEFTDDGDLTDNNMWRHGYRPITYNPYKYESFVYADTGEPIYEAKQLVVIGKNIYKVA